MKTNKYLTGLLILTAFLLIGCEKDMDSPPVAELPEGNIITIDSLRNIYAAADTTFTDDISIYGVITADEVSANLYKELYIQDETNAIKLELTSSSDYFIGDRVRVALKGSTLRQDQAMIIVDNVDPDASIVRQQSGMDLSPEVVTIADLAIVGNYSPYQSKLVQLNNVEFQCFEMCKTWADPVTQYDENRELVDTAFNTIVVRSSGYSNFAAETLPMGQGSVIAVVSQYLTTVQLTIRTPDELTLYGTRKTACLPFLQDFESEMVTTCDWSYQNVVGAVDWTVSDQGSTDFYGVISNYINGSNDTCETWYVSPAVNISSMANPMLHFESDVRYSGDPLQVYVTTNYTGDVTTTSWTPLAATLDTDDMNWGFVPSGNISLLPYISSNLRVAFKYMGSNTDGSTWELDDIKIEDI
jgi:hypothetical protein